MGISLNVFGDDADPIVRHLKETASNNKPAYRRSATDCQVALTQQCHERGVIRQDAHLAVEGRRD